MPAADHARRLRAGIETFVVASACGSRRGAARELTLQRPAAAGAVIVGPGMVAFGRLGSCEHTGLRAVPAPIRQRPS